MKKWMLAALFGAMLVFGCICGSLDGGEGMPSNDSGEPDGTPGQVPEEPQDSGGEAENGPQDAGQGAPEEPQEAAEEPEEQEGGDAASERKVDYQECIDSDGGDDRYNFGEISRRTYYTDGTFEDEELFSDECIGNYLLREYVCREGGTYRKTEWTCAKCEDGACVE